VDEIVCGINASKRRGQGIGITHVALDNLSTVSHFGTEELGVPRQASDTMPALLECPEEPAAHIPCGPSEQNVLAIRLHIV
jgi:hypothetical protein